MELKPGYKRTEVGVIPEDWATRRCSELTDRIMVGVVIRPTQYYVRHGIPAFRSANIREEGINDLDFVFINEKSNALLAKSQTRAGDVLTVRTGYPGTSAVVRPRHAGANCIDILITRPSASALDSDYLAIWVNSSFGKEQVLRNQGGNAQKHFNVGDMRNLVVALPHPPEQRGIAAALGDVDALLGGLDRLIAKKRDLKQAAMQQLLSGQTRLPGFGNGAGYKQTNVGLIPIDWDETSLLDVVRIARGQADPRKEPYRSLFLVGPVHVESRTGKLLFRQTAAEQGAISGKYLFEEGDIVYGKINPYLRKAFLAEFSGLCSADMYPLTPLNSTSSGFVLAVILGERFTKYAESVSIRSGMPKINRDEMAQFKFPAPSAKSEQTAIAGILSDMDAELAALEQRREKTRALKQAMMQELLTGKTRFVAVEMAHA